MTGSLIPPGTPYGCLAEPCPETRTTYPEISAHMAAAHGIPDESRPDPTRSTR